MTTRVIAIIGAPGVGKTDTGRALLHMCPVKAGLLDTDHLSSTTPWDINADFYRIVSRNLHDCLVNYQNWGAQVMIVTGVIMPDGIQTYLKNVIEDPQYDWQFYGLTARESIIEARIRKDLKDQVAEQRLKWLHINDMVASIADCITIDNSECSIIETAVLLAKHEGWMIPEVEEQRPNASPSGSAHPSAANRIDAQSTTKVPHLTVRETGIELLRRFDTPEHVAHQVIERLVRNEVNGIGSHGLLRLPEYIAEIHLGRLNPRSVPAINRVSTLASVIDGQRSFGAITTDAISAELLRLLNDEPMAAVAVRNSCHLGCLSDIAERVCGRHIVIGFCNFLGHGLKSPPWRGAEGRFCTNPVLFGFPSRDRPIIADLTTTIVSEGRIREAVLLNTLVPEGWLIDSQWKPVSDPKRLYTNPPTAFLAPIGGIAAYKGYVLALATEILSGVLTKAGFAGMPADMPGNGGLFIGLRPDLFHAIESDFLCDVQILGDYVTSCQAVDEYPRVRLPGDRLTHKEISPDAEIEISTDLWESIMTLKRQKEIIGELY